MDHYLIVRYSEIGIKGKNRSSFEKYLQKNIRLHLKPYGDPLVSRHWGRIVVKMKAGNKEQLLKTLTRIPGVANVSLAFYADLSFQSLLENSQRLVASCLPHHQERVLFRVSARRANKQFPLKSNEIEAQLGAALLERFPQLKVNLTEPQIDVGVEIWNKNAVVYAEKQQGIAGLPVNPNQRVISLISGGIDSPVASWMMMKRGCRVIYLHFHSFPFVGEQSKEKVIDLVRLLAHTQPLSRLYIAPFAEIQTAIREHCPEALRTILYRRVMNLIANHIAHKEKAKALVTGDSLSQVASQTLDNLVCTTENAEFPLLRPLIGMDKQEIIRMARTIGSYEISIQDFPDCCTVFQPQNPATSSSLRQIQHAEKNLLNLHELVLNAVTRCEIHDFSPAEAMVV